MIIYKGKLLTVCLEEHPVFGEELYTAYIQLQETMLIGQGGTEEEAINDLRITILNRGSKP